MSFSYTVNSRKRFGSLDIVVGTYENTSGDTGGDIVTGLNRVISIGLQTTGGSVATNAPSANETFPLNIGTVTIKTDANAAGVWTAIGE